MVSVREGDYKSKLIKAGNRVRLGSAPSNESYGYVLGFQLFQSYLGFIYHMLQGEVVEVFVVGDSATSLKALAGSATDVSLWAATGKTNDLVDQILQKFRKVKIKYV